MMSDEMTNKGSCLCGSVTITAKHLDPKVGVCHCSRCRKWTGGPLLAVHCGLEVTIDNEASVTVYPSSDWAERGFCKSCGSHLFYRFTESKEYIVPAGVFDDDRNFEMDHQIFIEEKPNYYSFANKTENMTGAEVFAKYAPADE
jgi:hypothetical protein